MNNLPGLRIVASGRYAPKQTMTNEQMAQIVETSDEWITTRTGMKVRHFCEADETNVTMAVKALEETLSKTDVDVNEIGALVVCTFSGDMQVPSAACMVQKALQLPDDMMCFDVNAACSGFVYGMQVMRGLLAQSEKPYGILIGSECISRRLDMTDRGTCILFGDGAGCVLVKADETKSYASIMGSHGDEAVINVYAKEGEEVKVRMDGQSTFRFAVSTVPPLMEKTAQKAGVSLDDIDLFICHQANIRIIDSIAKHLKQPKEKFYTNIQEYANTSAASIPLAISEAMDKGIVKEGDKVMLTGFGAGKTWGCILLTW